MGINMDILYTLEKLRVPFFNYFFLGISYLGAEIMSAIVVFSVYWCISKRDGYYIFANILFGSGLNQIIKTICHVPRPFVAHKDFTIVEKARSTAEGLSFPSGHTQNSTSLYGSLFALYKKKAFRIFCAVMIGLVGFSRLYLGAHYPTDVLGGFINGLIILAVVSLLFRRFESSPNFIWILFGVGGIALLAAGLIFEIGPGKTILEPEEMGSMLKGMYMCSGVSLGIALGEPIERKYVRFETDAVWWGQILKAAAGLLLILVLALALKYPAQAVFKELKVAYVPRFFVPVVFGICVWPAVFGRLGFLSRRK